MFRFFLESPLNKNEINVVNKYLCNNYVRILYKIYLTVMTFIIRRCYVMLYGYDVMYC